MGLRKILDDKESALHKVCKPVEKFDKKLHKLLDDMAETLEEANGVGLAAPQIGILRRVVIVDTGEKILELINKQTEVFSLILRRIHSRHNKGCCFQERAGFKLRNGSIRRSS